jgi:magnesium transporter
MTEADLDHLSTAELQEAWPALSVEEQVDGFTLLNDDEKQEFFSRLPTREALELLALLPESAQRDVLGALAPDDIADMIQQADDDQRQMITSLLDPSASVEIRALLAYAEDVAGGLMNPRYARLRAEMTIGEAITYLRAQKRGNLESIYYGYVVDSDQKLVGVVSFRELVMASPGIRLRDIMATELVTVLDTMDQERVSEIFARADLMCIPVVDAEGHMKGIVTADDIVDVVKEEATEDIHKLGGTEALDEPYLESRLHTLVKKRVGWLILLLVLGFVTVDLMSRYQAQMSSVAELAVLGFFVPMIISCGGNSGSQASTLVVRAMALGEVRLADWWRVIAREVAVGVGLGLVMGLVGMVAAIAWNALTHRMGSEYLSASVAVASGIVCVALWGTLAGSMLPFVLRRFKADPASASAPLVATLVDASGLVLYFTIAGAVLRLLG